MISAGTRNHFALDLGLDREDPATCLDALTDGEELRVDLGVIADRTFVNNASFGAYAEVVRSPRLPRRQAGHHLADAAGPAQRPPRRPVVRRRPAPPGSRARRPCRSATARTRWATWPGWAAEPGWMPGPALGVVAVRVDSARQVIGLLGRGHGTDSTMLTAGEVTVDADAPQIPVGIDGETVLLPAPVRCAIRPRALRVVVPRQRPGVPAPQGHPGMAAAAAARVLPRPAAQRGPPRPARQGAKPASTVGRRDRGDHCRGPSRAELGEFLWYQSVDHVEPRSRNPYRYAAGWRCRVPERSCPGGFAGQCAHPARSPVCLPVSPRRSSSAGSWCGRACSASSGSS